jgi:hypothetical protein
MSACEKCWTDSQFGGDYTKLLDARKDHPCTPEQQAGPDATECPECHRLTLHQHTGEPMCGCALDPTPWCSGCGAMKRKNCDCGPIAAND